MKILQFLRLPTTIYHLRPKFIHPLILEFLYFITKGSHTHKKHKKYKKHKKNKKWISSS